MIFPYFKLNKASRNLSILKITILRKINNGASQPSLKVQQRMPKSHNKKPRSNE